MTTVRELVFTDPSGLTDAAYRLGHDITISRAVIAKIAEALNFEVVDVLVGAWKTRSALLEAARETHETPGLVRHVNLARYGVPWDYELRLDIMVDGAKVMTLEFVLTLSFEVTALAAVVRKGALTKISSGRYAVVAVLKVEDHTVAEGERVFGLAEELDLGTGIALIKQAE